MIENPTEWFQTKTTDLDNILKKKEALLDMKSVVLNSEKKILKEIVHNVSVTPIFENLNKSDAKEIESICVVLSELLGEMAGDKLLEVYGDQIDRCLSHPSDEVKRTMLGLLEKTVSEDTVKKLIKDHSSLLLDIAGCLASSERSTSQGAISMFIKMGDYPIGVKALFSNPLLQKLMTVMAVGDTSRFRVYEIIVAVSKVSAKNLSGAVSSGLMGSLISEISSSDILVQLNALEMISVLATSNHGLSYLQENKVIQNLVGKLLKLYEEPLSLILLPGLIEFFGNLCALQPENFSKEYPQVMDLLFKSLETADEVLLGVIITTVGKVGCTCSGRLVLSQYDEKITNFFKKVGQILQTKNDLTVSTMNSLSELVKNIQGNANLSEISKRWFETITPNALESIVNLSKLPFVEFRLSAFSLLKSIATQEWGTEKLSHFPGMIEFLTDRSTEFNKDCKQFKFEVVFTMLQCPKIEEQVGQQVLLTLKEFVKEGPFYVPAQVDMATEGAV